jgi:hypothetical protein
MVLAVVCASAAFLGSASDDGLVSPWLVTGVIAAIDVLVIAILRPWSYRRETSGRAWAGFIAVVSIALLGARFITGAHVGLEPLGWFMAHIAIICGALIADSVAADLRELSRHRHDTPGARIVRDR